MQFLLIIVYVWEHKFMFSLTDRPKLVHNRCVIEVFGDVFVLSLCFLDFPMGVGAFVMGLSQISYFSLYSRTT